MRIGINGFEAVIPRFGYDEKGLPKRVGSSEFCFQLLKKLYELDKANNYIVYLPQEPTADMPKEIASWKYKVIPNKKLWTIFGLSKNLIKEKNLDLFFSPTHYSPLFSSCPQIISILDVSYKLFPEMFPKKDLLKLALWGKLSIRRAKKIITISNSSKNDIINEYRILANKVEVIPLGIKDVNASDMNKSEFIEKYNLKNPYVLFVGTLQPRKNIAKLIEAFAKLKTENLKLKTSLDLVIVGRKGWDYEKILEAPDKFGVSERVKFLEDVTNEDLPLFYKNAEVFVLPSLYEGFGLPILEAMQYDCPVVTSNVSSLPEAGGDAAIYFDPNNAEDIAEKIEKVISDPKLREEMVRKGKEQIKKFSWEKSAKDVIRIFETIND